MTYKNVILEKEGYLAVLTVNRPKALNALNKDTLARPSPINRGILGFHQNQALLPNQPLVAQKQHYLQPT
jgi:hypothetical protein